MAKTTVQSNNRSVKYYGKSHRETPRAPKPSKHVRKAHKRGLISEKQMRKLEGR